MHYRLLTGGPPECLAISSRGATSRQDLLEQIAYELGLDRDDPATALRKAYGARPKDAFIQDAWQLLQETWLDTDDDSREWIVDELRSAGLGRTDLGVRSKRGQFEYLGSCRNARTLREIVLSAFLYAGEPDVMDVPTARPSPADEDLPVTTSQPVAEPSPPPRAGTPIEERTHVDLDKWVERLLGQAFGVHKVDRDSDGDIPIPRGSAVVFVRTHDRKSPFLEIFAPLLHGFHMTNAVFEAVNAINEQIPLAKATVTAGGTSITLSAELFVESLTPRSLLMAVDLVGNAADRFDTLLKKRFGGSTVLEDDDDAVEI